MFPPKSSILIGFSIINHPFWGFYPYFWKHPYHPGHWNPCWATLHKNLIFPLRWIQFNYKHFRYRFKNLTCGIKLKNIWKRWLKEFKVCLWSLFLALHYLWFSKCFSSHAPADCPFSSQPPLIFFGSFWMLLEALAQMNAFTPDLRQFSVFLEKVLVKTMCARV